MDINLSTKSCCVVDSGLFCEWAVKLAESFGRVAYFTPWQSAFPKSNDLLIGKGLDGVERIYDFWSRIDEFDLFCFPDVYFGDWQEHLRKLGKRVWGSGHGDELELDRWKTKKLLKKLGLPVQHCELITGMADLREYLKENDDKWVKVSLVRGDFETFKHETYALTEPKLDELEHNLGAKKFVLQFIVEDDLPDRIEIGYDGFFAGGFPDVAMLGYEVKDLGLVGHVKKYSEFPEPVIEVNQALMPILASYDYRNFFSTEIRYGKDKKPFLTDPCLRSASPPSELYMEIFSNWGEIIWEGAEGKVVTPEPIAEYGCEIMVHSSWADANWQAVSFPDKIRPFVKLRNLTRINGQYYCVPQDVGLPEIGAVIGMGDTLDAAVQMAQENCSQIQGYYINCQTESVAKAMEQIKEGEKLGVHF